MPIYNRFYTFLFLVCIASFLLNCENADSSSNPPQINVSSKESSFDKSNLEERSKQKQFSSSGVSFLYEQSLAKEITLKKTNSSIDCDPNFRPDACEIQNLSFQLTGQYAKQHIDSDFHPQIDIYSIDEYVKVFKGGKNYSKLLSTQFQTLKSVLSEKPQVINSEYPYIPFLDATQILHSHLSYSSFEGGSGLMFITQFKNADPVLVNNKELVYIFQGITSDGKYLISATFPLKTLFLPSDQYVSGHKGYTIPENYFDDKTLSVNEENYKKYLLSVNQDVDSATDEEFTPNLAVIRKLITTLEIKPEILRQNL